jgi:serine/threonine protein kinase
MQGVDRFFRTALKSGLVDQDQLDAALREVLSDGQNNSEALANHLVRSGHLSRFQAHKLLAGKSLGLVLGSYQIMAPIGRGAMGRVYIARDTRAEHQLVALKVLPPKRAKQDDRLLARFLREMNLCQRVSHPHIAQTYEVGVTNGFYYIAMEFIPGRSLYRLVVDDGPLPLARAAHFCGEIAAALDHAHGLGLIHRDLKPSNILVTPHDHAKLLDLGLAIMQGEVPRNRAVVGGQGYIVGTMDYIAPEQAADSMNVDGRADIYSLGCSLYFALTGSPPFPGGTMREKIQRHQTEEPVLPTLLNTQLPLGFLPILRKMMAKNPEERFCSANEVREQLLPWAVGEPDQPSDLPSDAAFDQAIDSLTNNDGDTDTWEDVVSALEAGESPLSRLRARVADFLFGGQKPRAFAYYLIPVAIGGILGLVVAGMVMLIIKMVVVQ